MRCIINLLLFACIFMFNLSLAAQGFKVDFPEKSENELEEIRVPDIDLTGVWEGVVTQNHWDGQPIFEENRRTARIKVTQKGNKVSGTLVCRANFDKDMGKLSYEKDFIGTFDGQVLNYEDIKVHNYSNTHKTMRRLETCMKLAELEFYIKDGDYYLEGSWSGDGHISGGPCTPGYIRWKKINEKEEEENTFEVDFVSKKEKEEKEDIVLTKNNQVKKLKGRKVNKKGTKTVKVKSPYITIEVYDHKKNDGDIISLNYNGDWILENHQIDKEKHTVDVQIGEESNGMNYLILYAHNLGSVPPNTAAVIIDDGHKRQRYVLNSDLKQSDILYFTMDEK